MEQVQNEEQTEDFSFIGVTKAEAAEACERIKRRVQEHHEIVGRGQLLHRYRMGLVISGGAAGGLMAGHAMPAWTVALMVLVSVLAGGFFAKSINDLGEGD